MALPVYASPLEKLWHYAYLVLCALIFVFLIAPIIIIIPLSFNAEPYFTFTDKMLTFDPEGYSLRWYDKLITFGMAEPDAPRNMAFWLDFWHNATWMQVAKNSVIIGVCATVLSAGLGTVAALGLTRPEMPFRKQITAVLISPMIVPIIISATGMFFFYSGKWVPNVGPDGFEWGRLAGTYAGIILAHAALGIPFVIITVTATLSGFDQSLVRAAASLGANPRTAFFRVVMPLIMPGVISGGLFAFVTSFDEVVAVLFIADHTQQTIPRQMWNGIREQISPAILAVATLLVLLSISMLTVLELLRRRSERLRGMTPS
ncbi:ABC transporter permease [Rhodobacter maris]|uniref:Putative spermidine/putrescine transport system permease protein n=1 Tax=Rhodobacter maris TaxID=446682 RepID=A0A285SBK1_9RHOB|nr:ABC transporter permease [Rhodobacter maris]SOC04793.1 putative spermidine/putrescine transport system permease protein [Rhodobacter maris]